MRKDREEAFRLRKTGKSYRQIMAVLDVPRSTLSGWFGKEDWSREIQDRLTSVAREGHTLRICELNKVRGKHLKLAYEDAQAVAVEEFEFLKYNPLFIAAMMLYWGEGDKATRSKVRITNTDPEMLRLFCVFLKDVCNIDSAKIGAHVLIYPDNNAEEEKWYWSSKIGIPIEQFLKCTPIEGRHPTKRLGHGVCMLYVSSTYFKVKVMEWLKLLPQELISRTYYEKILPEAAIV